MIAKPAQWLMVVMVSAGVGSWMTQKSQTETQSFSHGSAMVQETVSPVAKFFQPIFQRAPETHSLSAASIATSLETASAPEESAPTETALAEAAPAPESQPNLTAELVQDPAQFDPSGLMPSWIPAPFNLESAPLAAEPSAQPASVTQREVASAVSGPGFVPNTNLNAKKEAGVVLGSLQSASTSSDASTPVRLSAEDVALVSKSYSAQFENSTRQVAGQECVYSRAQSCASMPRMNVHSLRWGLDQGLKSSGASVVLSGEGASLKATVSFKIQDQNLNETQVSFTSPVKHAVVKDETRNNESVRVFYLQFADSVVQGQLLRQIKMNIAISMENESNLVDSEVSFARNSFQVKGENWNEHAPNAAIQANDVYYIPSEMVYVLQLN